jgi:hypothetical protein
MLLMHTLEGLR